MNEVAGTLPSGGSREWSSFGWASILIVDDDEQNRQLLARSIARFGSQVRHAADGSSALEAMELWHVDLVLLDIAMPGMTGFEVLETMRSRDRLRDIGVIMVSAADDLESIVRAIRLGAEDYLPKPCPLEILRARIGSSLERMSLRSQQRAGRQRADRSETIVVPERQSDRAPTGDAPALERLRELIEGTRRFAGLVAAELPDASPLRSYLNEIDRAGHEASTIVRELAANE